MNTYRVYFKDGNQRMFGADNILDVMIYLVEEGRYTPDQVVKVEEV